MIRDELKALEEQNAILNSELKSLGENNSTLKSEQDTLRRQFDQMKEERTGNASAQDKLKQEMFDLKITPVPPQEQLTANERDQLEFFLKSPGIGMCFLSTAFYISGTDLGSSIKLAAQNALGEDVIGKVDENLPVGTRVRKMSNIAAQKLTGEKEGDDSEETNEPDEDESYLHKLLAPGRVFLTIIMPLLLLGVQFAYIFFIFKEGLDNYKSGLCPGYDVPNNYRRDPGFGADTQVRILIGFVGAYFVFKNISQLISYQRALKGNPAKPVTSTLKDISRNTAALVTAGVSAVQKAAHGGNTHTTVGVVGASMGQADQAIEGSLKTFDTR
jgi:hypothetical protein